MFYFGAVLSFFGHFGPSRIYRKRSAFSQPRFFKPPLTTTPLLSLHNRAFACVPMPWLALEDWWGPKARHPAVGDGHLVEPPHHLLLQRVLGTPSVRLINGWTSSDSRARACVMIFLLYIHMCATTCLYQQFKYPLPLSRRH